MTFLLIALIILSFPRIKFTRFNENYMSKDTTTLINGVFVILVFMSHFVQYVVLDVKTDAPYLFLRSKLDQLIVVSFLFYSGYGMMEAYLNKGKKYIQDIPIHKIMKLLLRFMIAIGCFLIVNLLMGTYYPIKTYLLALIGWESVGNSNWYVFVVLSLYLIFYLANSIGRDKSIMNLFILFILSFLLILALKYVGKDAYWYNTLLCFGMGVLFSRFKDVIKVLLKKDIAYIGIFISSLVLFIICYKLRNNILFYFIHAMIFMVLIVLVSAKVEMKSKVFIFLGKLVFPIYILQRIPMMIGKTLPFHNNLYVYFIFTFIITIGISILFDKLVKKIGL